MSLLPEPDPALIKQYLAHKSGVSSEYKRLLKYYNEYCEPNKNTFLSDFFKFPKKCSKKDLQEYIENENNKSLKRLLNSHESDKFKNQVVYTRNKCIKLNLNYFKNKNNLERDLKNFKIDLYVLQHLFYYHKDLVLVGDLLELTNKCLSRLNNLNLKETPELKKIYKSVQTLLNIFERKLGKFSNEAPRKSKSRSVQSKVSSRRDRHYRAYDSNKKSSSTSSTSSTSTNWSRNSKMRMDNILNPDKMAIPNILNPENGTYKHKTRKMAIPKNLSKMQLDYIMNAYSKGK